MIVRPTVEDLRRALRTGVCPSCPRRREGARGLAGADVPRPCESECGVFVRIGRVWKAASKADPMVSDRGKVVRAALREVLREGKGGRAFTEGFVREAAGRIEREYQD